MLHHDTYVNISSTLLMIKRFTNKFDNTNCDGFFYYDRRKRLFLPVYLLTKKHVETKQNTSKHMVSRDKNFSKLKTITIHINNNGCSPNPMFISK